MSRKGEAELDPRVVRDREKTGKLLGKAIARARADAKLSQDHVAASFGVSRQMIGQYESSISTLGANDLVRLAAVLRTTVGGLFKFEGKLRGSLESLNLDAKETDRIRSPKRGAL